MADHDPEAAQAAPPAPSARFVDPGAWLLDLVYECLVACPRCGRRARSALLLGAVGWRGARRLSCLHCGLVRDWPRAAPRASALRSDSSEPFFRVISIGDDRDPHFRAPLWLRAPCCGRTLWAYNCEHLDLLEAFVRAHFRTARPDSLLSNLPAWLISGHNRAEVLRAIARLHERLG